MQSRIGKTRGISIEKVIYKNTLSLASVHLIIDQNLILSKFSLNVDTDEIVCSIVIILYIRFYFYKIRSDKKYILFLIG